MSARPASMRSNRPSKARQRGAALFVAMIMLLLMLLMAVVGMRTITLESRIAGNMLESQRLQETADGSLRQGERVIQKYGLSLAQCPPEATTPLTAGKPCFTAEARNYGLNSDFGNSAEVTGFSRTWGYWYPRYIATQCPKGSSATAALETANTGCMEFYELNAQATATQGVKECGPDALCLRSAINLFIK